MTRSSAFAGLLLLGVALAIAPSQTLAAPSKSPVVALYSQAQADFAALKNNSKLQKYRDNYLKVLASYRKVFDGFPKTRQAELSLMRAGELYTLLFAWTSRESDLDHAQSYYQRIIDRYPGSSLVDDAQVAIGYLHLNHYQDFAQACAAFRDAVRLMPHGDRAAEAARMAKKLERFALPPTAPKPEPAVPSPGSEAFPVPAPAAGTQPPSHVTNIRHWSNPEYTRVVVDLDLPTNFYANLLKDPSVAGQPPRLYIDLFNSRVDTRFCDPIPVNDGILVKIRSGQNTLDTVRVVLEIDRLLNYRIFPMENPFRIVIDVTGGEGPDGGAPRSSGPAAFPIMEAAPFPPLAPLPGSSPPDGKPAPTARSTPAPETPGVVVRHPAPVPGPAPSPTPAKGARPPAPSSPAISSSPRLSLAQQLGLGVRRVVIDAGHGAHDPGATGVNGLKEKDVTLDIARRLRDLLERAGFETSLTRDRDVYLPLEERTALANTARGDLFISLHCNSSDAGNLHGIETYFLNLASSRRAMATAARENSMSVARMSDLEPILKAIFTSKMDESSRFAEIVQKNMHRTLRKRHRDVRDLGVKQAPFYVLIGAEMPSILAEVSFINHKYEGKRLASAAYRQAIAAALADGVKQYSRSVNAAALETKTTPKTKTKTR